ncbi:MAG: M16 family metallopeptidase [Alphaproteobacteria bacterium]
MGMNRLPRVPRPGFNPALLLTVLLALVLAACGDGKSSGSGSEAGETAFVHENSDLKPDPAVVWGVTDTGMRYALMPNDTPEGRVSVRYFVRAGDLYGAEDQSGIAHFLEHMAFNGSEDIPPGELVELLQRHGLAFGADTNASTGFEQTVYRLDLPNNKPELIRIALKIMRETAFRLTLLPEEIEKERGVLLSEKRSRNTAERRYFGAWFDHVFPGLGLGGKINDSEEFIRTVTAEEFEQFYRGFYTPERSFVVVTGDMDPAEVEPVLRDLFGEFNSPENPPGEPELAAPKDRGFETALHSDKDLPTLISFDAVEPYRERPDTRETRKEAIELALAAAMFNRRFDTIAQRPDAPFLQAGASYSAEFEVAEVARLFAVSSPEKWRESVRVAEQEIRRALKHGFTKAELAEQAANFRKSAQDAVKAANTRQTPSLADGLVSSFDAEEVFTHPSTDLELVEEVLEEFTPERAAEVFRKHFGGLEEPLILVAGDIELDDPEAEIAEVYKNSRKVAVEATGEAEENSFAYTDFGEPGEVVGREEIEDLGVTQLTFANGVRANLKPTDFEEDSVELRVSISGGLLDYPEGKEGLGLLGQVAFAQGGLGEHSFDELQRLTAGRTVGGGFSPDEEFFALAGRTTPGDLELQLQLLAAYVTDPGFRPEGLQAFRQVLPIFYQQQNARPQGVANLRIGRILRDGDARFGFPETLEPLTGLTLEDLKAWIEEPLESAYMEITLVGDFDPERAETLLAETFGALPARAAEPAAYDPADDAVTFADLDETVVLTHGGKEEQALLRVYWLTTDGRERQKSRALSVLARVLGDRLRKHVREEEGASYSPFATSSGSLVFPGVGYILANASVDREDADKYLKVLLDTAAGMAKGTISEDELSRALTPILEGLPSQKQSNVFWLTVLDGTQAYPERLERIRHLEADYRAVTVEQLNALAAEYLQPEGARTFTILPGKGSR